MADSIDKLRWRALVLMRELELINAEIQKRLCSVCGKELLAQGLDGKCVSCRKEIIEVTG